MAIEKGHALLRLGDAGHVHLDIPANAAGVIKERIGQLTPVEQLTIRVVGVLSRRFDTGSLAALHPSADLSSTDARFRHFATVLGLKPSSRLSCATEACDRRMAARTAYVVVAQP